MAWSRHIGKEYAPFEVLWGHGSSPFLYRDTVLLLCEHPGGAYLLALDKRCVILSRNSVSFGVVGGQIRSRIVVNMKPDFVTFLVRAQKAV